MELKLEKTSTKELEGLAVEGKDVSEAKIEKSLNSFYSLTIQLFKSNPSPPLAFWK